MESPEMKRDDSTEPNMRREQLSALMDGDDSSVEDALQFWRDDVGARSDWHAFHLIGELMRSDDVRCVPHYDAQFLAGLRKRLASEPVALAAAAAFPSSDVPVRRGSSRRGWVGPVAIAAGFFAVAGVLVLTRAGAPTGVEEDRSLRLVNQEATPPASTAVTGGGALIRNAELDRYLAAHRQYSSTSALPTPGAFVHSAATTAPDR
jgi:sigma-E factor negative regulatory protein RseA